MHWTALTGKTENHLCKRNTCLLRFAKLSTSAKIVLQDSNFILGAKKGRGGQCDLMKRAQLTKKAIYSISFEMKMRRKKGKVLCAYIFIFTPVSESIKIKKFK